MEFTVSEAAAASYFCPMTLIDTHTHLYLEQFSEDRDAMIERAIQEGVALMLLPNIDASSLEGMKELAKAHPDTMRMMMGLHPCSVGQDLSAQLELVYQELKSGDYIAVGEMGMDLFWDQTHVEAQKRAFRTQVAWAKEFDLPLVLHVRDAFEETFELLDELNDDCLRGVFHCFTGGEEEVHKIDAYGGFMFGIGGVLTFKKAGLDQVLPLIPREKLVLETDSPYLAPAPYRGKRNESSYIKFVAQRAADVLEMSMADLAELTTDNAKRLFRL